MKQFGIREQGAGCSPPGLTVISRKTIHIWNISSSHRTSTATSTDRNTEGEKRIGTKGGVYPVPE